MSRILLVLLTIVLAAAAEPASADWLGRILTAGEQVGARATSKLSTTDRLAHGVRTTAPGRSGPLLGAAVSQEGHWTFVNAAGEQLTAASTDEMRRVLPLLVGSGDKKVGFLLSEDTLFRHAEHLKTLPAGSDLALLFGTDVYALVRRGDRLAAEVRPAVVLPIHERAPFEEGLRQLSRPLNRSNVRVLSLTADGPETLPRRPVLDASGKPETDVITAYKLPAALSALRGQTAVVIGRQDGALLYFRLPNGSERSILLADLVDAAARHDVDLVILQASAARQPGTRNWLWQRIEVSGLEQARERPTLADFVDAVAGGNRSAPVEVVALTRSDGRTQLAITRNTTGGSSVGDYLADLAAEVTGKVVSVRADAYVASTDRKNELSRRLVPGIPSDLQLVYLGAVVLGLLGLPAARRWWGRLWPPEQREDYAAAPGFYLARIVRMLAFLVLFLPVVSVPAATWHIARQLWELVIWPFRGLAALLNRRSERQTG